MGFSPAGSAMEDPVGGEMNVPGITSRKGRPAAFGGTGPLPGPGPGGAGAAARDRPVGYKSGMRTVAAVTLLLALAPLAIPQGVFLRLPLLDQAGLPLSGRPVEVWVQGPAGTELIQGVPGPAGVLEEAVSLSPVSSLTIAAAGYFPAQVTELYTLEVRQGRAVRVYLVPPEPVRLLPAPGVPWAPGGLSWADFRGPPPPHHDEEAARIHIVLSYRLFPRMVQNGEGWRATLPPEGVLTQCSMDPIRSWVWPGAETQDLLAHEQGHFDLAEVYRRLLVAELVGLTGTGPSPVAAQAALLARATAIAEAILGRMEVAQHHYDEETRHGLDAAAQASWLFQISSWLITPELAP